MKWQTENYQSFKHGLLAQLVERFVYTEDVRGSSPLGPTTEFTDSKFDTLAERWNTLGNEGSDKYFSNEYLSEFFVKYVY
jgi:hypothetical protein